MSEMSIRSAWSLFRTTALLMIVFGVSLEALALPPPAPAGTLFRKTGDTAIYMSVWNYKRLIANPAVLSGCGLASAPVASYGNAVALMPTGHEINTLADCLNAVVDANRAPRTSCEKYIFDSGALAEAYAFYGTLDNKKGQSLKAAVKADIIALTSHQEKDKTACSASPAQDELSALIDNSQPQGPSSSTAICQSSCSGIDRAWNGNWSCDPPNVTGAGGIYGQNCVCSCFGSTTARYDFPISPELPADIHGGASTATLTTAAEFAWQQFIALNWPALQQNGKVMRDTPDPKAVFGTQRGPLVWHTFRHKVEIFPGPNSPNDPPHGYFPPPQANLEKQEDPYGYNDPPKYVYSKQYYQDSNGEVPACPGQKPVTQPAWISVDETSEIGLANMYAGVLGGVAPSPNNSAPQQIRYLAKANKTEYDYVVKNQLWWYPDTGAPLNERIHHWKKALKAGVPPDPSSVVNFPVGTIEVKSAWRPLAPGEDKNRFHTATVRYYEVGANSLPCYWEATWAMVALHLIHKTPTAPSFIFTTFEQADNLLLEDGTKVEDANGKIVHAPMDSNPNTPALTYTDSPTAPVVSIGTQPYCAKPGKRLYYQEIPPGQGISPGTPTGGNICVNSRYEAIPPEIQTVNKRAHNAISTYNQKNGVSDSPWLYYKLVNVQTIPFNASEITFQKDSAKQVSSFYQANIVVETDYTLQQFKGRLANDNAPSSYPKPDAGPQPDFQNVYVPAGNHFQTYQMGGCMGCHGNAQVGGFDFSFILGGNPDKPDMPTPNDPQATQAPRYRHRKFFSNVPRLTHLEAH